MLSGSAESNTRDRTATNGPCYSAVGRTITAMREHGSLSLAEMADIAHLSPYHFSRVFRRVTGIPPGEFMSALRIERAKRLLLTTDLGVGEVCFEVGYNSPGTFTTRFTKLVGLAPGKLRQLPKKLTLAQEQELEYGPVETGIATPGVAGRIEAEGLRHALIFAGLFPGAIPQRGPVAGVIMKSPGDFMVTGVPGGIYHLMAAAVPLSKDLQSLLLPGNDLRVGRAERLIAVRGGMAEGRTVVSLRPMQPTDPPILTPLPMLLLERMNSTVPEPIKRAR